MKQKDITPTLRLLLCFMAAAMVCAGALLLSVMVPRQSIRANMLESAEYLRQGELFGLGADGAEGSRIDRYADAILLNIVWHLDETDALQSAMRCGYYSDIHYEVNDNLYASVSQDLPATEQYLRYWHGSAVVLRPLLTVLDIRQIYRLNALLLAAGMAWLLTVLARRRWWVPLAGLTLGLVAMGVWWVPLSLEYTWLFLLLPPPLNCSTT